MTRSPVAAVAVVILMLVGIPLGAFVVARATRPPQRHVSRTAAAVRRLTAELKRDGATSITCGRTRYANASGSTVTCTGVMRGNSSFDMLAETVTDLGS